MTGAGTTSHVLPNMHTDMQRSAGRRSQVTIAAASGPGARPSPATTGVASGPGARPSPATTGVVTAQTGKRRRFVSPAIGTHADTRESRFISSPPQRCLDHQTPGDPWGAAGFLPDEIRRRNADGISHTRQ